MICYLKFVSFETAAIYSLLKLNAKMDQINVTKNFASKISNPMGFTEPECFIVLKTEIRSRNTLFEDRIMPRRGYL
jgi:hypothetical protein